MEADDDELNQTNETIPYDDEEGLLEEMSSTETDHDDTLSAHSSSGRCRQLPSYLKDYEL